MKKGKIRKMVKEKVAEISGTTQKICQGFPPENIHQFRVALKSLRSFLRLYWMYTGQAKPVIADKLMKLYHIAGEVRDLHIELGKLKKVKGLPAAYMHRLGEEMTAKQIEWDKHYTKRIINKAGRQLIDFEYEDLQVFALNYFVINREEFINELRGKVNLDDEDMHHVRKLVKDIVYTVNLAKGRWKAAFKEVHIPLEQFSKLAADIGNYNDERLMLEHIASYDKSGLEPHELKSLESFCKKGKTALKNKRKNVHTALEMFDAGGDYLIN